MSNATQQADCVKFWLHLQNSGSIFSPQFYQRGEPPKSMIASVRMRRAFLRAYVKGIDDKIPGK